MREHINGFLDELDKLAGFFGGPTAEERLQSEPAAAERWAGGHVTPGDVLGPQQRRAVRAGFTPEQAQYMAGKYQDGRENSVSQGLKGALSGAGVGGFAGYSLGAIADRLGAGGVARPIGAAVGTLLGGLGGASLGVRYSRGAQAARVRAEQGGEKQAGFFGQSIAERMATSPIDEAEAEAPFANPYSPFEGVQEQAAMEDFRGRARAGLTGGAVAGGAAGAGLGYGASRLLGVQNPWAQGALAAGGGVLGSIAGGLGGMSAGGRSALQNTAERMQITNPGMAKYLQHLHQLRQAHQGE